MTSTVTAAEPLPEAYRRLTLECIGKAVSALGEPQGRDIAIHTIRKQCKQLRALIRLFERGPVPERRQACASLRDIGRVLSASRDARVALGVHAALLERYGDLLRADAVASVQDSLDAGLRSLHAALGESLVGSQELHRPLLALRVRAREASRAGDDEELLRSALVRSYRRARRAARSVAESRSPADFHEARKRAKDYGYQLEFTADRWPSIAASRIASVHRLSELLGDAQDCEVYCAALENSAAGCSEAATGLLQALAQARALALREEALGLSADVFAEKPRALAAALAAAPAETEPLEPLHRAAG